MTVGKDSHLKEERLHSRNAVDIRDAVKILIYRAFSCELLEAVPGPFAARLPVVKAVSLARAEQFLHQILVPVHAG